MDAKWPTPDRVNIVQAQHQCLRVEICGPGYKLHSMWALDPAPDELRLGGPTGSRAFGQNRQRRYGSTAHQRPFTVNFTGFPPTASSGTAQFPRRGDRLGIPLRMPLWLLRTIQPGLPGGVLPEKATPSLARMIRLDCSELVEWLHSRIGLLRTLGNI